MSVYDILCSTGGLLVLLILIQISPIKINPWSALAKAIGQAVNADVLKRVDDFEKKLDDMSRQLDTMRTEEEERNAVECRIRILRFGDEILHEKKHSKEHFDQIMQDITSYEHYCDAHPNFPNNSTVITAQIIKETYHKRLENHDFL
jgi:predicted metal-dependent hydrolase